MLVLTAYRNLWKCPIRYYHRRPPLRTPVLSKNWVSTPKMCMAYCGETLSAQWSLLTDHRHRLALTNVSIADALLLSKQGYWTDPQFTFAGLRTSVLVSDSWASCCLMMWNGCVCLGLPIPMSAEIESGHLESSRRRLKGAIDVDDDFDDNGSRQKPDHRTFFPETWLWRLEKMRSVWVGTLACGYYIFLCIFFLRFCLFSNETFNDRCKSGGRLYKI